MNEHALDFFKKSGILPLEVYDEEQASNPICEVTIVDSISGGVDETNNMPNKVSLSRMRLIDGKWIQFDATYTLKEVKSEVVNFLNK